MRSARKGQDRPRVATPLLAAWVTLAVLIVILGALRSGTFSLLEINTDCTAAMALILVGVGETLVLLRGGIDLSVGGTTSLATALAATRFAGPGHPALGWSLAILALGAGVGAVNGLVISFFALQPFLVTLASWSIVGGTALIVLPTEGGAVPQAWVDAGAGRYLGLTLGSWALLGVVFWWAWFRRTRAFAMIRAAGSNERSAYLSGVSPAAANGMAYALSGLFAALAGLFLVTQTGAGSPSVGNGLVLPAVTAAVIGGTRLSGGRGGVVGTILGAFILTLIADVVFVLQVSSYWQPVLSGVILIAAMLGAVVAETRGEARR